MTELPAGYAFQAPAAGDVDAVGAMLVADQLAAGFQPTLDAAFVRQMWRRPDFDLGSDAWVVIDVTRTVVAYGQIMREEPSIVGSWGVVHVEHRGLGIGTSMLDRIEGRAATLFVDVESPRFRHSITAGDRPAEAILRDRGMQPIRHFWHMQLDLAGPLDPGAAPDGIEIGGIRPADDLKAIHAVLEAAFVDDPSGPPDPFDQWAERHLASPTYDPTLWLLARDGDVPVGVLIGSAGDDGGWVDWLAVLDSHRGRGIAMALLRSAFAMLAERGVAHVLLNVDAENVTGATRVYERAGMRVVNRWDLWERRSLQAG
jgi:GNAT superfamily N-acetyltransferase